MAGLDKLRKVFPSQIKTEANSTANVLIMPSGITKDMAKEIVKKVSVDGLVKDVAILMAKMVGDSLIQGALRPSDYFDIRDIPDRLVERTIEALAKKPEEFFKTFAENLKNQG